MPVCNLMQGRESLFAQLEGPVHLQFTQYTMPAYEEGNNENFAPVSQLYGQKKWHGQWTQLKPQKIRSGRSLKIKILEQGDTDVTNNKQIFA